MNQRYWWIGLVAALVGIVLFGWIIGVVILVIGSIAVIASEIGRHLEAKKAKDMTIDELHKHYYGEKSGEDR